MSAVLRIALVDDHEVVRDGLRSLIESETGWAVVAEAATATDAPDVIATAAPDVAILDLHLPDGSGVDVCRAIKDRGLATRVLVLTSDSDDDALLAAVVAGADAYVLKHLDSHRLLDAIRRLAAGEALLDAHLRERVLARIQHPDRPGSLGGLSDQEQRVLALLADGLTNRQIAQCLHLAEKTVKNYVSNVLLKLGVSRRSEAAVRLAVVEARAADHSRAPSGDAIRW